MTDHIDQARELLPELKEELSSAEWTGKNAARFFDRGEANRKIPRLKALISILTAFVNQRDAVLEEAAKLADTEPELPGPMPDSLNLLSNEDLARMSCRVTKASIARAIRALKTQSPTEEKP